MLDLSPDQKGSASLTLGQVVVDTRNNFPDPRFRPELVLDSGQYHLYGINASPYKVWVTADGVGTKPDLAERLSTQQRTSLTEHDKGYEAYSSIAHDVVAMVESDAARWGFPTVGIANIVDTNYADPKMIDALSKGLREACDIGQFALFNGETAELGYRASGFGDSRVNWNAVGVYLINQDKFLDARNLEPGQPLVALQEKGIRSNGLSLARRILEAEFLQHNGMQTKAEYFEREFIDHFFGQGLTLPDTIDTNQTITWLDSFMGHPFLEQALLPWHEANPKIIQELLRPSTLYSPLMYAAQGGVDGPRPIEMVAAAHISGGGIPEKVMRMVFPKGLGVDIETVFPEPEGIASLLTIAERHKSQTGQELVNTRSASENWNRGIGFVIATRSIQEADNLIKMAQDLGYGAAIAGEITDKPIIRFKTRSGTEHWTYKLAA